MSFAKAKRAAIRDWEYSYLSRLIDQASGNISFAARLADMDRGHLSELLKNHNISVEVYK